MVLNANGKPKTNDRQTTVTGRIKQTATGEMLVFSVYLGLFELVALCNIPEDGQDSAPVYVKWKIAAPRLPRTEMQSRHDRDEVRDDRNDDYEDEPNAG